MAVKFMKARGNHTTVISRGEAKKEDALVNLKADAYLGEITRAMTSAL